MYIERCVNKSKFLLYVPRMVTETRQNGFLDLPLTANKVRTFLSVSISTKLLASGSEAAAYSLQ